MFKAFLSLLKRDLVMGFRQSTDLYMILVFFVIAAALFPLGVGPDPAVLGRIASGVVWVLALLSILLSLDRIFAHDYEDGSLEVMLLGPQPFIILALAKTLAHWLSATLPLVILAPVIAIMLNMDMSGIPALMYGLLLGTPTLSLIGAVGAALALGARRAGLLMALLVLPLFIPVLIFGVTVIDAALNSFSIRPHLLILAALLAAAIPLAPWAAAAAVRQAVTNK
ncbi:heme exporter protein CcmB [Curvivirga aplysinae]|uniref:heme exporter protein CcmB n=1 Tax=Curvivirga aplysinae TaxID=2529852 RepID=UPI0012BCC3B4|nr:heme exporter protein CcmB [Curvivirga aplysinae]MTI08509.1 heme exporter protein CcmB [Curvivirga aplysinae]